MKKHLITLLVGFALTMSILSCTENERAKNFGGSMNVQIQPNEVFINATWKEDELWIVTKDTVTKEFHFREHSSFGIMEGEVKFK